MNVIPGFMLLIFVCWAEVMGCLYYLRFTILGSLQPFSVSELEGGELSSESAQGQCPFHKLHILLEGILIIIIFH